mgnify:CR=1 FL=1
MKKKLLALTLAGVMALSLAACGSTEETQDPAASGDGTYTIGICQLVQHDALDAATQGFQDALTKRTSPSWSRTPPMTPPPARPSAASSSPRAWT